MLVYEQRDTVSVSETTTTAFHKMNFLFTL